MLQGHVNTFAGNPLDRAGERRGDAAWLAAAARDPQALSVVMSKGRPLVEGDGADGVRVSYVRADLAQEVSGAQGLFMGLWKETPVFASQVSEDAVLGPLSGMGEFAELREVALRLSAGEAAICATAKGMFEWHGRHGFCAACGGPSTLSEGGWKRVCGSCGAEHFPRTDPVAIMLAVHRDPKLGERCLVGRQERWPARMFSALAGFIEPGELIEEACARELKEEAGLVATSVAYQSSQPWPFPSSLMIGLIAQVDSDVVVADPVELHDHHWLTKAEAREVIAGRHPLIRQTSKVAIAHYLLKAWAEG